MTRRALTAVAVTSFSFPILAKERLGLSARVTSMARRSVIACNTLTNLEALNAFTELSDRADGFMTRDDRELYLVVSTSGVSTKRKRRDELCP